LINEDGSVQNKAEFLADVKATNNNFQEQQVSPESMSVQVFGNAAVAIRVFRAKGVEGGKSYVRWERFVDTWIYKNGAWCASLPTRRQFYNASSTSSLTAPGHPQSACCEKFAEPRTI
jgi:uncharacterized protein DUF4440